MSCSCSAAKTRSASHDPIRILGFESSIDGNRIAAIALDGPLTKTVVLDLEERRIISYKTRAFQLEAAPIWHGNSLVAEATKLSDDKRRDASPERYILVLADDLSSATVFDRVLSDIATPLDLVSVGSDLYAYDLGAYWYRNVRTGARLGGRKSIHATTLPKAGIANNEVVLMPLYPQIRVDVNGPPRPKGLLSMDIKTETTSVATNSTYSGPYDVLGRLFVWNVVDQKTGKSMLEVRSTGNPHDLVRDRVIDIRAERIWLTQSGQCAFVQGDGVTRLVNLENGNARDTPNYADIIRIAANRFVALDQHLQKVSIVEVSRQEECCTMLERTKGNVANFNREEIEIEVVGVER